MTVKEYNNFYIRCSNAICFVRNLRNIPKKFLTSTGVSTEMDNFGFDKNMEDLIVKALEMYQKDKKSEFEMER